MVASLAVVGGQAVCEPSEQAEGLESWQICLELDLTCLRCRARKRGNGGGKAKSWHGAQKLAKRHRHHKPRLAGLRRDETTPKTQPHAKSCFSHYYTKVHTSLLSAEAIMFQCLHLPAPCFNPGPPPDIYGSLTFDTPLHLRAITCCGWLLSISCDAYSPVCLLYRLVVSLFFFFFFFYFLLLHQHTSPMQLYITTTSHHLNTTQLYK